MAFGGVKDGRGGGGGWDCAVMPLGIKDESD